MSIENNYGLLRERIEKACHKAGRNIDEITLVAITKFVPAERIEPIFKLGIKAIGENRAQEFIEKLEFFNGFGVDKHFVGQLQTNKVKYIIGCANIIQSVDRVSLASAINKVAKDMEISQDILIQVNIGDEPQKGGIRVDELEGFYETLDAMNYLSVKGLMVVPPALSAEEARPYFSKTRRLFETAPKIRGEQMKILSMGMSNDYEVAVEEGTTMVRIGSALFGARHI